MIRLFFKKLGANLPVAKKRPTDLTQRPLWHVFILFVALLFLPQVISAQKTLKAIYCESDSHLDNPLRILFFIYDTRDYSDWVAQRVKIANTADDWEYATKSVQVGNETQGRKCVIYFPYHCNHDQEGLPHHDECTGKLNPQGKPGNNLHILKVYEGDLFKTKPWLNASEVAYVIRNKKCKTVNIKNEINAVYFIDSHVYSFEGYDEELGGAQLLLEKKTDNDFYDYKYKGSMSGLFMGLPNLKTVYDPHKLDVSQVTSMKDMFNGCTSLESARPFVIDPKKSVAISCFFTRKFVFDESVSESGSTWDTSNVKDMSDMFNGCRNLTYIDAYNFNTANVADMSRMFKRCYSLKNLIFGPNFYYNDNMGHQNVFEKCDSLRYLDFYATDYNKNKIGSSIGRLNEKDDNGNIIDNSGNLFYGVSPKAIIYLPAGRGKGLEDYRDSEGQNIVYTNSNVEGNLVCEKYVSGDTTAIEFPRNFMTKRAVYKRTMKGTNDYGSCILPYFFTENNSVRPYIMNDDIESDKIYMQFKSVASVRSHQPFVFKKKDENAEVADFTMESNDYSIQINATHSTNSMEYKWTINGNYPPSLQDRGDAYTGSDQEETSTISSDQRSKGWKVKAYYGKRPLWDSRVWDNEGKLVSGQDDITGSFYIGGNTFRTCISRIQYGRWGETNPNKGVTKITIQPHRAVFVNNSIFAEPTGAKEFGEFSVESVLDEDDITAIMEAELREDMSEAEAIYDMQGRKIAALQRGINIVRMSDGSVKKVIIK